jgi:nucleoside-diphosphate-sugar epimerase
VKPLALVTGAPGWLGSRIVHSLVHGVEGVARLGPSDRVVRCLVLPDVDTTELEAISPHVRVVRGDITQPETLTAFFQDAQGATLFHSAGLIHPTHGTKQFFDVNVEGTRNLVAGAATSGVKRMVHVSSNSPIGTNPSQDHVFDESAPYNPYMTYGKTKMLAERLVLEANERGELEVVVIRPPWFYGPGQPPRQTLFFEMIRDGKAPIVGDGENRRSMAYVDNICQGLLLCELVPEARGQVYWIADERPYSMNEIIGTIERVLEQDFAVKVQHKRMKLPGIASSIAYGVDGLFQSLGGYHQKIHVLSEMNKTIACTVEKAKRELGYAPRVALEDGMRKSIQWMQERGIQL